MTIRSSTRLRASLKSSAISDASAVLGLLLVAPFIVTPALANPAGGAVTSGAASISSSSLHQTTITQKSEDVVIDWTSFNIGSGQTTQFVQPNAQAIAVNRVGGAQASQIMGTLDANGRIVLINGNGMLFGRGSQVNVGSLVATSTDDTDSNVLAGRFSKSGNQNAAVANQGRINASQGGLVALVAPSVTNIGTVNARFGTVALGAANKFTVDFAGDGLVSFAAQGDANGKATATNTGSLVGANVSLTARAAEGLATGVVNMSGVVLAQTARNQGGTIVLDAGDGGDVIVSHASLNASGANGGGNVVIGSWSQNAVSVDNASVIDASATNIGNGGAISVISSNTSFAGRAVAQGGAHSGNGGTIETSGHTLAFGGASINASATNGSSGHWLLDPYDLTVDSSAAATIDSTLNSGTGVTLQTTASGSSGPGVQNSSGNGDIYIESPLSWSTAATLTLDAYHSIFIDAPILASRGGGLTMLTDDDGTGGDLSFTNGNVTFDKLTSALSINGASYALVDNVATLAADIAADPSGDYALAHGYNAKADGTYTSSPISTAFSGTFEGLGNTISALTIDDTADTDVGLFASTASGAMVRDIVLHAVVTGNANDASVGALIGTMASGSSVDNASSSGSISSDSLICRNCGPASGVGGLVGSSAGSITGSSSSANVWSEGQYDYTGGLIGTDTGTIANSFATGKVSGSNDPRIGGLVGEDEAQTIDNSYATGAVFGSGTNVSIGGFAGQALGLIENSYATGKVTGSLTSEAGGLVGVEAGTIESSYATGDVSGRLAGGLVGYEQGGTLISGSYATGTVTGGYGASAGGLVGISFQCNITDSYATGAVHMGNGPEPTDSLDAAGGLVGSFSSGTISGSYAHGTVTAGANDFVGGLVGYNGGTINNSYASGAVSGGKSAVVGGLAGAGDIINNSYATGSVTGGLDSIDGGLIGDDPYNVYYSYSTGTVSGRSGSLVGGFVGNSGDEVFSDDYWDLTTSGITNPSQGAGNVSNQPNITGLTTAQFQSGLPAGFDPSVWGEDPSINGGLPYLLASPPT